MVAYNKKQRNKRKIPAVLPATVGTIAGVGGTAALTKAYLLRQQEYANNEKNASLYDGNEGIFGKNSDGKYIKAGDDGVYTQKEYLDAVKDHYYTTTTNADGTTTTTFKKESGVTQEYADSIIKQAENDPNLFMDGEVDSNSVLLKPKLTQLNINFGTIQNNTSITNKLDEKQWKEFTETLNVKDTVGISEDSFKDQFTKFCNEKGIKDPESINGMFNALRGTAGQAATPGVDGAPDTPAVPSTEVFGQGKAITKVVNTKYADNAAVYEKMSNNATKQNFSFRNSLESAREIAATKIGNNSLICKEIAKATGADAIYVAGKVVDTTATVGLAAIAGLSAIAARKVFNKVGNYFERKKEERAEKKEQKVAEMKRSLSQARAANAMRVQMAGDFENTASNGRFNNRG